MLELFDHRDPELLALSDNICTALQLTNFWQDVRIDLERDRVYLPLDDLASFDLSVDILKRWKLESSEQTDAGMEERWRGLMALEAERTWESVHERQAAARARGSAASPPASPDLADGDVDPVENRGR